MKKYTLKYTVSLLSISLIVLLSEGVQGNQNSQIKNQDPQKATDFTQIPEAKIKSKEEFLRFLYPNSKGIPKLEPIKEQNISPLRMNMIKLPSETSVDELKDKIRN